jgi:hypothetical protein
MVSVRGWLINIEQLVEKKKIAGEIEVLEENLPPVPFCSQRSHMNITGNEAVPQGREASD